MNKLEIVITLAIIALAIPSTIGLAVADDSSSSGSSSSSSGSSDSGSGSSKSSDSGSSSSSDKSSSDSSKSDSSTPTTTTTPTTNSVNQDTPGQNEVVQHNIPTQGQKGCEFDCPHKIIALTPTFCELHPKACEPRHFCDFHPNSCPVVIVRHETVNHDHTKVIHDVSSNSNTGTLTLTQQQCIAGVVSLAIGNTNSNQQNTVDASVAAIQGCLQH